MKSFLLIVVSFVLLTLDPGGSLAQDKPEVRLVSTHVAGLIETDKGPYYEFFNEAARQSGFNVTIEVKPWKRAVSATEKSPDKFIFPFTRNAERETRFQWGALLTRTITTFVTFDRKIDTLEQARQLNTIIVWRGTTQESYLNENAFDNLFTITSADTIPALLWKNNETGWFGSAHEIEKTIASLDPHHPDLVFGDPIDTEEIWLATGLNTNVPRYYEFLAAVEKLAKDGLLSRLLSAESNK